MNHPLDNMIWNAISTGNRDIAQLENGVGAYEPDIAPFAGMEKLDADHFERFHAFIPAGKRTVVAFLDDLPFNEKKWKMIKHMACYQMVYEHPVSSFLTENSSLIEPLTEEHIPQMLELTALTKPGPFLDRTHLFGNYFGIFQDGRLAAMTGQRMHPVPYLEVSAVCTHPDFRGHGYAKAIMLHVMKLIVDRSFIPFLHVLTRNSTAIGLYESIGYRIRKQISIDVIERI